MKVLMQLDRVFNWIIDFFAVVAAVMIGLMMVGVSIAVFMNYVSQPIIWVIELSQYGLVLMTFLAAPWVLKRNGYVVMGLIREKQKPAVQRKMDLAIYFMGALTCMILVFYGAKVGMDYFQTNFTYSDSSYFTIPAWSMEIWIPISFALMFIQFIKMFHSSWKMKDSLNK
jgi:C4-dicarboxylate transporter, DctQ subunit